MRNEKGQFVKGSKKPKEYEEARLKSLPGNNHRRKLKTEDLRQEAYDSYLAHIAKGKSKKSWSYEKNGQILTWSNIERYIYEFPHELDPKKLEQAYASGMAYWEEVVDKGAKADRKVNPPVLQMLMRNKFGWDKQDPNSSGNRIFAETEIRRLREISRPFPEQRSINTSEFDDL